MQFKFIHLGAVKCNNALKKVEYQTTASQKNEKESVGQIMNLVQKFPGNIKVVQSGVWDKPWELECLECQWLIFAIHLVHCNGLQFPILWLDKNGYLG